MEQAKDPARQKIDKAATTVEQAVEPATSKIQTAAGKVETKLAAAIEVIDSEQEKALLKLKVPSIDELGEIKTQIEELKRTGGRLNLRNIRSFVDLEVVLVLIFSILALGISVAAWIRAGKKGQ